MVLTGLNGCYILIPMISDMPLINLVGYNGCLFFSTTMAAYNWQKLTSGFGMAYFRYLCIKRSEVCFELGTTRILKAIISGQSILLFFGVILSVVRDMTRKGLKFGYCEEVPLDFYKIKEDYEG